MKKIFIFYSLLLFVCHDNYAQDSNNLWIIGLGTNAVDFYPTNESETITGNQAGLGSQLFNVNDHWNKFGLPKINITRYLSKRFSADISFAMNKIKIIGEHKIDEISYQTIDARLQYSFLKDNYKFSPNISIGIGRTWLDNIGSETLNGGLGITYWFTEQFGINGMASYKYTLGKQPKILQHLCYSASIVFRFGSKKEDINCEDCLKKEELEQ